MKLADLFTRLHAALLILRGKVTLPDVPSKDMEIAMAWDKAKASIQQVEDALSRAAANKSASDQQVATLTSANQTLQAELDAADEQIAELLQPVVDAAEQLAPAPAPQSTPGGPATLTV